jgi:hypothetical protein
MRMVKLRRLTRLSKNPLYRCISACGGALVVTFGVGCRQVVVGRIKGTTYRHVGPLRGISPSDYWLTGPGRAKRCGRAVAHLLHPNSKRLISLLKLLVFKPAQPPAPATASRAPWVCAGCGGCMRVVSRRLRDLVGGMTAATDSNINTSDG